MEREVVKMNEKTLIRIPKNLVKILVHDVRYSDHLYFSSVTYVPFLKLWLLDNDEFAETVDDIENSVWFYHHSKVKWWIETTAKTYNEYCEIYRDYSNSTERYTTLVKRYCKWV